MAQRPVDDDFIVVFSTYNEAQAEAFRELLRGEGLESNVGRVTMQLGSAEVRVLVERKEAERARELVAAFESETARIVCEACGAEHAASDDVCPACGAELGTQAGAPAQA